VDGDGDKWMRHNTFPILAAHMMTLVDSQQRLDRVNKATMVSFISHVRPLGALLATDVQHSA